MAYAYSENFILPISHDEVVHGKGSMFERVPQDEWRKFGTLRAFYAFMWAHPGKKLLFMGTEFGQNARVLRAPQHRLVAERRVGPPRGAATGQGSEQIYRDHPAMWRLDTDPSGFSWIDADDRGGNVFSFLRYDGEGQMIACITNFSSEPRPDYRIGLPTEGDLDRDPQHRRRRLRRHRRRSATSARSSPTLCPRTATSPPPAVTLPPLGAVWLRLEATPGRGAGGAGEGDQGVQAAAKLASPHRSSLPTSRPSARASPGESAVGRIAAAHLVTRRPAVAPPTAGAHRIRRFDLPQRRRPASPSRQHPTSARPRPERPPTTPKS